MNSEIITIGDELLIGQVIDTNSAWMAGKLNMIGISVDRKISVADKGEEIKNCLKESLSRAGVVILTGGLGPTKDDVTKKALCEFFDTPLVFREDIFIRVKAIFDRRKIPMPAINRTQAEVPESCTVIENTRGTAPGMWFVKDGKIVVSLPGVPFEMKTMMEQFVLPELQKMFADQHIFHKTILTHGIGESTLAEKIAHWEDALPKEIRLAYLPSPGMIRLRLSSAGDNMKGVETEVMKRVQELEKIIPQYIFGYEEDTVEEIIGRLLLKENKSLCVAESCTGGAISKFLVRVPGSSSYFKGGVVAYSYESKNNLLSVGLDTLEKFGAVSKETVIEMAKGAKAIFQSDYSIATSGIAGPSGGTPDKPVGMVWMAVSSPRRTIAEKFMFGKDREINILLASQAALHLLRKEMTNSF